MRSKPNELELLRSEMILSTLSGCTAESWKEQVLPVIKVLSLARGSDTGGGRFSLILLTLFRNLTNKLPVIEFYKWDSQSFGNQGIVINGYVKKYRIYRRNFHCFIQTYLGFSVVDSSEHLINTFYEGFNVLFSLYWIFFV